MRHAFSLVGAVFRHESVATSDFSHSSDCSVSPGGWSGSARVVQNSPHVGPSNRVTVPRSRVAGRHACLSPGHKRPAALMAHQRGVKPACLWPANHAACALKRGARLTERDRGAGRAFPQDASPDRSRNAIARDLCSRDFQSGSRSSRHARRHTSTVPQR